LPKKSLGQHFLWDKNIIGKIVRSLEINPKDALVEIGPGQGALTREVIKYEYNSYLLLEKDKKLCKLLKSILPGLDVVNLDALNFNWEKLNTLKSLKIFGNLPYNIASPLLWNLVSALTSYQKGLFMVQKEVAERIVAKPGSKVYGALSVWIQSFARPRLLFNVSPKVFFPRPKVWSSVIELKPKANLPANPSNLADLIKTMFQSRRKQLQKIIKTKFSSQKLEVLQELGLSPTLRPEDLSVEDFQRLAAKILNL